MPYLRIPLDLKMIIGRFSPGFGWDYYYDTYLGGMLRAGNGRFFIEYSF